MARRICLKVSFGENKQLSALAAVKRNILEARSGILNEVKPAFKDWNYQHPEIKVEEGEETIYLFGSVDFEKEEALSKEILEKCDELYKKIEEYDALMKIEISKAPEGTGAGE